MWELINEPENHFINAKSAQKSTTTEKIRHGVPGVMVWPSDLPSCMRELGEINYGLIAAASGAFTSWRPISHLPIRKRIVNRHERCRDMCGI